MEKQNISATLKFSSTGKLVDILLFCSNLDEQKVLEKAIKRHVKCDRFEWFKRFFGKG